MTRTQLPSWITMDPSELGKAGAQSLHITCQECLVPHLNYRISTCPSCSLPYCTDHLFKDYHHCSQRQKDKPNSSTTSPLIGASLPSKPTVYTHETQCTHLTCKKMIDLDRGTGGKCDICHEIFCWSHQKEFAHDCRKPQTSAASAATSRGLAAFNLFKAKNASRKAAAAEKKSAVGTTSATQQPQQKSISRFVPLSLRGSSGTSAVTGAAALKDLRDKAKGTATVPEAKRLFVFITAQAPKSDTSTSKTEPKPIELSACFNADWKIGKVLDKALEYCGLENRNNRTSEYEEKWDMLLLGNEKSKVLERNERFGDVVKNGERIVLMKGIGQVVE